MFSPRSRLWCNRPHESRGTFSYQGGLRGEGFVEIVIWRVPSPVPPSQHPYKYRLVYVVDGERRVGYDNERGKGDHKHIGNQEAPYRFVNPQQLMADFIADIEGVEQ
ncbi:toxin-antitoxin system TumE family protein [Methylococcus sp. ANG]|uniref:toxin-antitoxin system TumE family protein n=1 Tax=Methylococcus sp. ANG TaxID=3231903 RepID=UPI003C12B8C0